MNAETILDALSQLPDDLIAATDALRQKKKSPILWKRLVPMAACFVLVLGALYIVLPVLEPKESQNAAPEAAAPMEMMQDAMSQNEVAGAGESPAAGAPKKEADRETANDGAPLAPENAEGETGAASSKTEVTGYGYCIGSEEPDDTEITLISTAKEWDAYLTEMTRLQDAEDFENTYDAAYFEENQLIAVVTAAASSSVRYEAETIAKTGSGTWELTITQYNPEWFTDDMEQQLILIELPRMVEPEDEITLNLDAVTE